MLWVKNCRNLSVCVGGGERDISLTRHNSADPVPTSNRVCITEVAIRTTLCIAGII